MWFPVLTKEVASRSNCQGRCLSLTVVATLVGALVTPLALATTRSVNETFDSLKKGEAPAGWQSGFAGTGGRPHWITAPDPSAPSPPHVLHQDGRAVNSWIVNPAVQFENGEASVRFKIESGREDPEAGLLVRFRDGGNYTYVRANTVENDVIFYHMVNGKKEMVKRVAIKVAPGAWHNLKMAFKEQAFKIYYDDKEILLLLDSQPSRIGSVGLWTTADTVADFDDFAASGI